MNHPPLPGTDLPCDCVVCQGNQTGMHNRADFHRHMRKLIADHQLGIIGIHEDPERGTPRFAYTVGLTPHGLPELLMIGEIPHDLFRLILNDVGRACIEAGRPLLGRMDGVLRGLPLGLVEVDVQEADKHYTCQVMDILERPAPYRVVQVLWPDAEGTLPNEAGYHAERFPQPLLTPLIPPDTTIH